MKNFLSLDNLILEDKNSINNIIQSSSEVSDCSITNILEENSSLIWISNEELPQEITLNISRSFLREFPKKISAIGIYCWHAYPTNPKLVEVLISKNDNNNFISFGNFDLCLKPGRQLLQLDEGDNNFLITENDNYIIKLIIKETYGDKRTYINNIYLYENIDFMASGIINTMNTFETIKEEDDSSSIFYLRESRERTLPRKKNNSLSTNNNTNANPLSNNNLNNFYNNNQKQSNTSKKINSELNSKDLTIDEFEIITKTKVKDNKIVDKNKNNILVSNNTYDNDESNININTLGPESQYNGTYSEYSSKNNGLKNDDLSHRNILLTKANDNLDNIDEELNNIKNNLSKNQINNEENKKDNNNNLKKNGNNPESPDVSLSSEDLDTFGLLKGTKTHQKNFYIPPKMSEIDEELENLELQHSISGLKFKTNNDILNKKISDNYFSMSNNSNSTKKNMNKIINSQNNYNNQNLSNNKDNFKKISNNDNNLKKISNNLEDFSKKKNLNLNYIEKNNNSIEINENNLNDNENKSNKSSDKNNIINEIKNDNNNDEIHKIKEEMSLLKDEFKNYKKEQEEIIKQYQDKITNLESHIKRLQINSNKMNDVVKTLLEAQYIQNQTNNDFLLNQMRKIASETFANIFSNISQLANLEPSSSPSITIQNQNQSNQSRQTSIPSYNDNITNIKMYEDKTKHTYQTTRRKMYSIDKVHKQQNNSYSINYNISNNLNNNLIKNNEEKNKVNNNIYNKKFNDDIKASRLKKHNSGRNIVLRKNYINQNNYINFDNQKYYANNNSIENNDNNDNNGEEQINGNLFYQTGYPTETNKNIFQRGKNINRNEILKINNNNLNNNILNDKKEIVHRRIFTNCYKKKTFSPIKKSRHSYVVYTDSDHLFPETTVNASDKNKNFNFNLNNNENEIENENEENEETNSNDDAPLKVSQLKTEKRNYNPNKIISNEKNNFDEEKENGDENNENQNIGDTLDIFTNLQNKYGDKLNEEIKKDSNRKNQRYAQENLKTNEIKRNTGNADKNINNTKKKITVKNDSLISLIYRYNRNNKNKEVSNE